MVINGFAHEINGEVIDVTISKVFDNFSNCFVIIKPCINSLDVNCIITTKAIPMKYDFCLYGQVTCGVL